MFLLNLVGLGIFLPIAILGALGFVVAMVAVSVAGGILILPALVITRLIKFAKPEADTLLLLFFLSTLTLYAELAALITWALI